MDATKEKKSARATDTTGAGNQPEICLGEKDEANVDENKDSTREIKRKKKNVCGVAGSTCARFRASALSE